MRYGVSGDNTEDVTYSINANVSDSGDQASIASFFY